METRITLKLSVGVLLAVTLAVQVHAARVNLDVFENAHGADVSGLDLWVDVLDAGPGLVDFVFHNDSSVFSSVTSIYFEDGLEAYIDDGFVHDASTGVGFEEVRKEKDPPGGANIGWKHDTFMQFNRQSSRGGDWGINPDQVMPETLTIRFDYIADDGLAGLVAALLGDNARIAAHIQRLGDCDASVSAVTYSLPDEGGTGVGQRIVPLPAAVWTGLATMAAMGLGGLRRLRRSA